MQHELKTPHLWRRMACWLYEGLLMFGVVFVADYLFDALSQSRHALDYRTARQFFLFVIFGIYFVWFWSKGQTLAMKTWHIRLVNLQGGAVTQARALLRYGLSWVWFVPALGALALSPMALQGGEPAAVIAGWVAVWAALSCLQPSRQFWHDVWAGTLLVDVRTTDHPLPLAAP